MKIAVQNEILSTDKKELEHLSLSLVLYIIDTRDVKQNAGFIFDERLKWLYGGYKVLLRDYRSINQASKQASKKCFWKENNDIEEYKMDTQFDSDWGD